MSSRIKRKLKKTFAVIMAAAAVFLSIPFAAQAEEVQTTIIMLDNKKSVYSIGERLTFTIGVSSPDGAYITEAYCGFGYNASTMRLISETDTSDHVWIRSDTAKKWIYSKDITFEITHDGRVYFIAGAYEGPGKIQATRADGSRIACPRASVWYKAGTGIYTPTSDCDLSSLVIKDAATGEDIPLNRAFDKNITEYYNGSVVSDRITIHAEADIKEDKVILPDDLTLHEGVNEVIIKVEAVDGASKEYVLRLTKPKTYADVKSITLKDDKGVEIPFSFDPDTFEYDITVPKDVTKITFKADAGEKVKIDYPPVTDIDAGYNLKSLTASTESDEKKYDFFIFRELPKLSISSLVVANAFDEDYVIALEPEFDPETYEYRGSVPSDINEVIITYTLADPDSTRVLEQEENSFKQKLSAGEETTVLLTVSDDFNEQAYTLTLTRDQGIIVTEAETQPPTPAVNDKAFTTVEVKDYRKFYLIGAFVIAAIVIGAIAIVITQKKGYDQSDEAKAEKEEKERAKRLKELEKKRTGNKKSK